MQRILNALIQFRNVVLYLLLLFIALVFINGNSEFHKTIFSRYGFYVSQRFQSMNHKMTYFFSLSEVNKKLLEENTALKALELQNNSIALYPDALTQKARFPFKVVGANVIKNGFLSQRNYVILGRGKAGGIQPEMAVISKNGVVGLVQDVSENYSNVISILHQDMKINVRLKNNRAFGSLAWKGKHPQDFQIEDIVTSAQIRVGDTLITGGMSSYFPVGIPLGKVVQLDSSQLDGYYTIDVKLFEDPSQVQYVYLLENKDREEITDINQKKNP